MSLPRQEMNTCSWNEQELICFPNNNNISSPGRILNDNNTSSTNIPREGNEKLILVSTIHTYFAFFSFIFINFQFVFQKYFMFAYAITTITL